MGSLVEQFDEPLKRSTLFFVLSGEHASLPEAEVEAILESSRTGYEVSARSYRLLTLEAPKEALRPVSERSLMYEWCGIVIGECEADEHQIARLVHNLPLGNLTKGARDFAVRSTRLGEASGRIRRTELEGKVGSIVRQCLPSLRVNLSNPELTFACVLFDNRFLLGISAFRKPSGLIAPRRPRKRPVFHPATMPPKIARCMVNLARTRPGALFLDPFCGVGGIVIEACVIGAHAIGIDASPRMLRGARRNLDHFNLEPSGLLNADARRIPLRDVDAIATDPPYGRGSSTMGSKVTSLVMDFLADARACMKRGAHLCISAPVEIPVEEYAQDASLRLRERHLVKVHRSLTRQFVVLQNA